MRSFPTTRPSGSPTAGSRSSSPPTPCRCGHPLATPARSRSSPSRHSSRRRSVASTKASRSGRSSIRRGCSCRCRSPSEHGGLPMSVLDGKGSHLVTTNDYLAKAGAGWMAPIYQALGASVAYIAHEKSAIYDALVELDAVDPRHRHWRDVTRREAYRADITYGQNSEFGFDYLRDNMVMELGDQVQGPLHFAIVDEADSILIDEARTPLIISSASEDASEVYYNFARVAQQLKPDTDYILEEKHHAVALTEEGIGR